MCLHRWERSEGAMAIFKRGSVCWYRFEWGGEPICESTRQGDEQTARDLESAHRARLAQELDARRGAERRLNCAQVTRCEECERWFRAADAHKAADHTFCGSGCARAWTKRHTRIPTLAEFLGNDFKQYMEVHCAAKPNTVAYYAYGASLLLRTDIVSSPLNEITSQHAAAFIAIHPKLSRSTVNAGLRTLRRALNLAAEWGKIDRAPRFTLAKGERQRDRVITQAEFSAYRDLCHQPWRDIATVLYGTGMRPGEAYALRWEHVQLNGSGGLIQVAEGKTKAARRFLPMLPEVYAVLKTRHEAQGKPSAGWIFPAPRGLRLGHIEKGTVQFFHRKALRDLAKSQPKFKPFEIYCLRHSALTMLAVSGCDAFTLARIAGHSSIAITQRYCHPQADAIQRAFGALASVPKIGHTA
jgi:integrase